MEHRDGLGDSFWDGPAVRFGLFMTQVNKDWPRIVEQFRMAEELGYDHAWLADHLLDPHGSPDNRCMEAWSLLAGIAANTSRIRIGVLVTSNTFRHPSLLLKQAVTVDHISGGRVILGLGTGWHEDEHRRFGLEFPSPGERVERLRETATIARSLMGQQRTTFHGRYYRLEDAPAEPRPLQQPRIQILIAAHRPRMLRTAAEFADMWDTFPTLEGTATENVTPDVAERIRQLDTYCLELGRDPAEIRRSLWATEDAVRSEETFRNFYETYRPLGFTDFTTTLPRGDDFGVLKRIASDVIPALRTAAS